MSQQASLYSWNNVQRRWHALPPGRYSSIIIALCFGLLLTLPSQAQSLLTNPNPYVLRITSKGCTHSPTVRRQTGFRVQKMPGIVTALHGVLDCTTIGAVSDDGQIVLTDLQLMKVDIDHDIALLWSPSFDRLVDIDGSTADGLVPSTLSSRVILSTTLEIIGYPLGLEKQDADTIERVRAIESLDDTIPDAEEPAEFVRRKSPSITVDVLNLQAQLLPGHSGAPILDDKGHLVAVGSGGLRGGTVARSWAMPWSDVVLQDVESAEIRQRVATLVENDPQRALGFSSTYPEQANTETGFAIYSVHVTDRNSLPIESAEVTLAHTQGYEIGFTDSEGFAIFWLNVALDYTSSTLLIEASGYQSVSRTIVNPAQKKGVEEFHLVDSAVEATPTATSTLTPTAAPPQPTISVANQVCEFAFLVLDRQNNRPIRQAEITVTLAGRIDVGQTDSTGFYGSKLPCADPAEATVQVRIRAVGYEAYSQSVFVIGETKEILLTLLATSTPTPTTTPNVPPTATLTPRPTPCDIASNPYGLSGRQAERVACPAQDWIASRGVVTQQFAGGFMIVFDDPANNDFQTRNPQRKTYILADDGRAWRVYFESADLWQSSSPNPDDWYSCDAAPGLRPVESGVPWRGFGLIWCTYPQIRQALGAVLTDETKANASFQSYYRGRAFQIQGEMAVYVVFLDADDETIDNLYLTGTWEVRAGESNEGDGSTVPTPRLTATPVRPATFHTTVTADCNDTKGQVWFAGAVTRNGQPVNGYRVLFKSAKVPGNEPATAPAITGLHTDHPTWAAGTYEHLVDAASWLAKPKSLQIWLEDGSGRVVSDYGYWETDGATGACNKAVVDFDWP